MTEKYIETNGAYFIRMPSGRLQQVTQDDWEQSKAADAAVIASPHHTDAAVHPAHTTVGAETRERILKDHAEKEGRG
jgi:hypothetical protein